MTYPILPLTPAAFTVEVLNSATNDLMRLWRLEARIDTYLSVVSPARTRPQQPQSQFAAPSPPTLPTPVPAPSRITVVEVPTIHPVETATVPRGRGRKAAVAKKPRASAAKSSAASAASTSSLTTADNDTPTSPLSSLSASASSLGSPPPTSSGHSQHPLDVDLADHDVDLDFDCRVETIERLPTPIAAALTLGSTPNGSDMDKIKLYGILAASYLATSALYKVVQPCASVQEYFAQRFRLSRTQLARILHAAQVILDLSATPRDPVDLVPFPLSLDVACAVHKCAGPSRRARRALWSAVLLTSSATDRGDDGDLGQGNEQDARHRQGITRRDVERAMPLVVQHGIQFYLDAASVDVNSGGVEEEQHAPAMSPSSAAASPLLGNPVTDAAVAAADENRPQVSKPVKGVRYRDVELASLASSSSSSSSAPGSLRFHPYARRPSGMSTANGDTHEYVTPPDTPATALLHGAAAGATREKKARPTPTWRCNVPGAAAMDDAEDADHMDVDEEVVDEPVLKPEEQGQGQEQARAQEDADMADVLSSSIMSPPTSPAVGTLPSDSVLFGGPSPSRTRGTSAVSIDLLVAAADFVEQQERRTSVSSTANSVPPTSPTANQFFVAPDTARSDRGPPKYPIEFVMIPFGAKQEPSLIRSSSPSAPSRAVSPLSLEFSMAAAKVMMPSPSPSPVHCNADDAAAEQAKAAAPVPGFRYASSPTTASSPPRPTSSSLFGVIATSSSSRSPSPVPMASRSSSSQVAAKPMARGLLEECEA